MKKIDLKCPSCGGIMKVSEDKTEITCQYCKHKFLIEKEKTIEELKEQEEAISYAREKGIRKAKDEALKTEKKNNRKVFFLTLGGIIALSTISVTISYYTKEYLPDPFRCIDIKFIGTSGKGEAKIISNGKCEESKDIDFSTTTVKNLKEGDEIYVDASSSKYRFETDRKKYIVKGLSNYLTDINNLTEEMIAKIHKLSSEELKETGSVTKNAKILSLTPYKLYLYTDGENKSILYDVYKIKIKSNYDGKTYEKIKATSFEDFVILDENDELFRYSRLSREGNVIHAGEDGVYGFGYIGTIIGYKSIDEFKGDINKNNDGRFKIQEK